MKIQVVLLCVFANILNTDAYGDYPSNPNYGYYPKNTAYGYFKNIGIPEAERLRRESEQRNAASMFRIVGGQEATLGQFKYQVGLIISLFDIEGNAVCGGSLISRQRVVTAAHCWNDGYNQGYAMQVVLGTTNVYEGGVRQDTFAVRIHPAYRAVTGANDIAIVYLPQPVQLTANIGLIALPSGSDLQNNFVGYSVVASGYGRQTEDVSVPVNYDLKYVNLTVITNARCSELQNQTVPASALCASSEDGSNVCGGDSGGPLVTHGSNGTLILIGIVSHSIDDNCESHAVPAAYTRVTTFVNWLNGFL